MKRENAFFEEMKRVGHAWDDERRARLEQRKINNKNPAELRLPERFDQFFYQYSQRDLKGIFCSFANVSA